jgi:hypothetical protein
MRELMLDALTLSSGSGPDFAVVCTETAKEQPANLLFFRMPDPWRPKDFRGERDVVR